MSAGLPGDGGRETEGGKTRKERSRTRRREEREDEQNWTLERHGNFSKISQGVAIENCLPCSSGRLPQNLPVFLSSSSPRRRSPPEDVRSAGCPTPGSIALRWKVFNQSTLPANDQWSVPFRGLLPRGSAMTPMTSAGPLARARPTAQSTADRGVLAEKSTLEIVATAAFTTAIQQR